MNVYGQKFVNGKVVCEDKCGDGKISTLDCDLAKGNLYDGCTSDCRVETGFVC